jgi:hypothetical protein
VSGYLNPIGWLKNILTLILIFTMLMSITACEEDNPPPRVTLAPIPTAPVVTNPPANNNNAQQQEFINCNDCGASVEKSNTYGYNETRICSNCVVNCNGCGEKMRKGENYDPNTQTSCSGCDNNSGGNNNNNDDNNNDGDNVIFGGGTLADGSCAMCYGSGKCPVAGCEWASMCVGCSNTRRCWSCAGMGSVGGNAGGGALPPNGGGGGGSRKIKEPCTHINCNAGRRLCTHCGGTGSLGFENPGINGNTCRTCNGSGNISCIPCLGTGFVERWVHD